MFFSNLIIEDGVCKGVETISKSRYYSEAVVLATGTYFNPRSREGSDCVILHSLLPKHIENIK